jgi:hypothetical protein
VKAFYAHFNIDANFVGMLTKLRKTSIVEEFIASFEQFEIKTKSLTNEFFKDGFTNDIREEIKAEVEMYRPATWFEASQLAKHA